MIHNKIISLVYKSIFISISFISLYNTLYNFSGDTLAYFTILSNIVVFVFFLILWIKTLQDVLKKKTDGANTHLIRTKGIATLCITVTGLVYAFLLADYTSKSNYTFQNLSHHYIIPVMTVLDYFLFDQKGKLKWYHPLLWVGCSLLYLPYIFIRAIILGPNTSLIRYPYFFLDLDTLGVGGVALWCVGLVVFFSILAYLIFLYDCWYVKHKEKKELIVVEK